MVGCGSIGSRHARNAKRLGFDLVLVDRDRSRLCSLGKELETDLLYTDHRLAFNHCATNGVIIDAAVIATPTHMHVHQALWLAKHGVHLFIEKPLSDSLGRVHDLAAEADRKKIVTMMGQSHRFHEGIIKLGELLDEGIVGKVLTVDYYGGQYLPDWHPGADYRKEYAARRDMGGGVMLTSMSHAFDIITALFGKIEKINGWKARLGGLEIDVDDFAFCLLKTDRGIIVRCGSDFLQRPQTHKMTVYGEHGHIEADFMRHEINYYGTTQGGGSIKYNFDPNARYVAEMRHFVRLLASGVSRHPLDVHAGIETLENVLSPNVEDLI